MSRSSSPFASPSDDPSPRDNISAAQKPESVLPALLQHFGETIWEWNIESGRFRIGSEDSTFAEFVDSIFPDDRESVLRTLTTALDSENRTFLSEFRLSRDPGRWMQDRGTVEPDSTGQPHRVVGLRREVTAIKTAELAREESTRRQRNLDQIARIASLTWNPLTGVQHASAGWEALLGPDSPPFRDYALLVASANRAAVAGAINRLLTTGTRIEVSHALANDLTKHVNLVAEQLDGMIYATVFDVSDRRRAEYALRQLDEQFRAAIESSFDAFILLDAVRDSSGKVTDFTIRHLNRQTETVTRRPIEILIGRRVSELKFPAHFRRFFAKYRRLLRTRRNIQDEVQIRDGDTSRWFLHRATGVGDSVAISLSDMTARKVAAQALADQKRLLESISALSPDLICLDDIRASRLIYANKSPETWLKAEATNGSRLSFERFGAIVRPEDVAIVREFHDRVSRLAEDGHLIVTLNISDGRWIQMRSSVFDRTPDGLPALVLTNFRDVTREREHAAQLEALASTDVLTGVFNRRHFEARLRAEIERADRYGHPLALVIVDIDNFKSYNDRFGHQFGDEVLRDFAQTLVTCARIADIVARYGGEEFAIILPVTTVKEAGMFCERVRTHLAATVFGEHQVKVTGSFGCAQHRKGPRALEDLIGRADAVQYDSKKSGKDRVTIDRT